LQWIVAIGFWKIVAWTGLLLAGALYLVEPLELFSYFAAPTCLLAAEHVGPGLFVENKANGATVRRDASATTDEEAAPLAMRSGSHPSPAKFPANRELFREFR
jgi:hypothetical protein